MYNGSDLGAKGAKVYPPTDRCATWLLRNLERTKQH